MRLIALEEHFMMPEFVDYWASTFPNISSELGGKAHDSLVDFGERRLSMMDAHSIDFAVLSLAGPGVQVEQHAAAATLNARVVNDFLAMEVSRQPLRYGAFAHLAMLVRAKICHGNAERLLRLKVARS